MARPRAFISFQMEDKSARDFLAQQAKDERNDFEFFDYSVKDPFDASWRTECKRRIAMTKGTIVLVGKSDREKAIHVWLDGGRLVMAKREAIG